MTNYEDDYQGFSNEDMGLGQVVPQPKPNNSWLPYGSGAAGGVFTAAWYTGYATATLPFLPFAVPAALAVGTVCFGYAIYSTVSSDSLTRSDKAVLVVGGGAVSSMTLGAVGFVVPKVLFGMAAVTGPAAVPLMVGGAIAYGIADHYDQNHMLEEAKPAFYGFALGALPSSYFCLKSNEQQLNQFMFQQQQVAMNRPTEVAVYRGFLQQKQTTAQVADHVLKKHGTFINVQDLAQKIHQETHKQVKFGNAHDHVPIDDNGFATRERYAVHLQNNRAELVDRGRGSYNAAIETITKDFPTTEELRGELTEGSVGWH